MTTGISMLLVHMIWAKNQTDEVLIFWVSLGQLVSYGSGCHTIVTFFRNMSDQPWFHLLETHELEKPLFSRKQKGKLGDIVSRVLIQRVLFAKVLSMQKLSYDNNHHDNEIKKLFLTIKRKDGER